MIRFFHLFWTKLRLSKPWKYKAPLLMAVPYFVYTLSMEYNRDALSYVFLSITTIVGIAGFGYLTNDLGDLEKDKLSGKENALINLSSISIVSLFAIFLIMALGPWLIFPTTWISFFLLAAELLLFTVYAFPPFRLKEKGIVGVFTDALYAHVLPAILAAYTFGLITNVQDKIILKFLIFYCLWQGFLGLRNIIMHQEKDLETDLISGTKTFVGKLDAQRTTKIIHTLVALEVTFFILFGVQYLNEALIILIGFLFFVGWRWWNIYNRITKQVGTTDYFYINYYLDEYYIQWMPVLLLVALSTNGMTYFKILLLHLVIFPNFLKTGFLDILLRLFDRLPMKLQNLLTR